MDRRTFLGILAGSLLATPLSGEAQQVKKIPRIGVLMTGNPSPPSPWIEAFRRGLHDLGYVEGHSILLEYRYAQGRFDQLPTLASELVQAKVDVIVTAASPAILAARRATDTIPIVFAVSGDPVATGFVASLAHPGGTVTGLSIQAPELSAKLLQLLKETGPKTSRVAVIWNPNNGSMVLRMREVEAAAPTLSLKIQSLELRSVEDFDPVFATLAKAPADAVLCLTDPFTIQHRQKIIDVIAKHRLPSIYESRDWVNAGGLMSYGVNIDDNFRR